MLKIGDVAKLTGIPVKTIRYWEEFGLIKPSYVDEYTGYRQFDEKDIERLSQIVYLKNLGFELKEIKNLDEKVINQKTKSLQEKIRQIKNSIVEISSLQKDKRGEYIMKNFVNDENAIGHWKLLGLADTQEEAKALKLRHNHDFKIEDMYLMENGKEYWVLAWTKGAIFINDRKNPYEIIDDKMIVALTYDGEVDCYAVYEMVDNKKHKMQDFMRIDNVDLPFVLDKKAIGVWKYFDFIRDPKEFDPTKKVWGPAFVKQLSILENGEVFFEYKDKDVFKHKWTKGHIFNDWNEENRTDMKYSIVKKEDIEYLIMEWKSGDYQYGGIISGYYVFKKEA